MRFLISCLTVVLLGCVPCCAETLPAKKLTGPEFRRMLAALPPVEEVQGRFNGGEKAVRGQLPGLKAQGDIIPALIETLNSLRPGTARNEAEMYRLALILMIAPDARANDLIERLKKLHPTVKGQNGLNAYPFDQVVGSMKFHQAQASGAACWEAALKGRNQKELLDALADARWFGLPSSTNCDPNQAYVLLNDECADDPCKLELILPRLARMSENAQTSAVQQLANMSWHGLRDPRIRTAVSAVSEQHPPTKETEPISRERRTLKEFEVGEVARRCLRDIDKYETAK
jgi:hypothetical protein